MTEPYQKLMAVGVTLALGAPARFLAEGERRQEQERFGAKDMQDYLHLEEISPYHYVPRMRETLNKTSPAVFLKEYRANPRSFFTHDALKKEE